MIESPLPSEGARDARNFRASRLERSPGCAANRIPYRDRDDPDAEDAAMTRESEELRQALRTIEAAVNAATAFLDPNQSDDRAALDDLDQAYTAVSHWRRELEKGRWPGRRVSSFPPGWDQQGEGGG